MDGMAASTTRDGTPLVWLSQEQMKFGRVLLLKSTEVQAALRFVEHNVCGNMDMRRVGCVNVVDGLIMSRDALREYIDSDKGRDMIRMQGADGEEMDQKEARAFTDAIDKKALVDGSEAKEKRGRKRKRGASRGKGGRGATKARKARTSSMSRRLEERSTKASERRERNDPSAPADVLYLTPDEVAAHMRSSRDAKANAVAGSGWDSSVPTVMGIPDTSVGSSAPEVDLEDLDQDQRAMVMGDVSQERQRGAAMRHRASAGRKAKKTVISDVYVDIPDKYQTVNMGAIYVNKGMDTVLINGMAVCVLKYSLGMVKWAESLYMPHIQTLCSEMLKDLLLYGFCVLRQDDVDDTSGLKVPVVVPLDSVRVAFTDEGLGRRKYLVYPSKATRRAIGEQDVEEKPYSDDEVTVIIHKPPHADGSLGTAISGLFEQFQHVLRAERLREAVQFAQMSSAVVYSQPNYPITVEGTSTVLDDPASDTGGEDRTRAYVASLARVMHMETEMAGVVGDRRGRDVERIMKRIRDSTGAERTGFRMETEEGDEAIAETLKIPARTLVAPPGMTVTHAPRPEIVVSVEEMKRRYALAVANFFGLSAVSVNETTKTGAYDIYEDRRTQTVTRNLKTVIQQAVEKAVRELLEDDNIEIMLANTLTVDRIKDLAMMGLTTIEDVRSMVSESSGIPMSYLNGNIGVKTYGAVRPDETDKKKPVRKGRGGASKEAEEGDEDDGEESEDSESESEEEPEEGEVLKPEDVKKARREKIKKVKRQSGAGKAK